MTDATQTTKPPSKLEQMMEAYGPALVTSLLGLLALQLLILAPLLHYGVPVDPLIVWVNDTFGTEVRTTDGQGLPWAASLVVAYGITRGLKVFSLPLAFAITPLVAKLPFLAKDDGAAD